MLFRSLIIGAVLALGTSVSTMTPASAHASNCSYYNGPYCKWAHNVRHHSAQALYQSPYAPSVGSYANPYKPYYQGYPYGGLGNVGFGGGFGTFGSNVGYPTGFGGGFINGGFGSGCGVQPFTTSVCGVGGSGYPVLY